MRVVVLCCFVLGMTCQEFVLGADPPLDDARLSIHTLVREDIFAGWRTQNMERFERGAKNVDVLLEKRPNDRADLLAWKGAVSLFRSVLSNDAGDDRPVSKAIRGRQGNVSPIQGNQCE